VGAHSRDASVRRGQGEEVAPAKGKPPSAKRRGEAESSDPKGKRGYEKNETTTESLKKETRSSRRTGQNRELQRRKRSNPITIEVGVNTHTFQRFAVRRKGEKGIDFRRRVKSPICPLEQRGGIERGMNRIGDSYRCLSPRESLSSTKGRRCF